MQIIQLLTMRKTIFRELLNGLTTMTWYTASAKHQHREWMPTIYVKQNKSWKTNLQIWFYTNKFNMIRILKYNVMKIWLIFLFFSSKSFFFSVVFLFAKCTPSSAEKYPATLGTNLKSKRFFFNFPSFPLKINIKILLITIHI